MTKDFIEEKCEHNVVKKFCFRCKRPDLAGSPPEEKCGCPTKYCKHFESDFDKYCKENPHCDECEKAMKCLEVAERNPPCEEEKEGWEERFDKEFIGNKMLDLLGSKCSAKNIRSFITSLLRSELATAREEERKRIDEEITKQFKYASEHDNYDMRGVDWSAITHPRN